MTKFFLNALIVTFAMVGCTLEKHAPVEMPKNPTPQSRVEKLIAEMGRQLRQFLELVFEGDER